MNKFCIPAMNASKLQFHCFIAIQEQPCLADLCLDDVYNVTIIEHFSMFFTIKIFHMSFYCQFAINWMMLVRHTARSSNFFNGFLTNVLVDMHFIFLSLQGFS